MTKSAVWSSGKSMWDDKAEAVGDRILAGPEDNPADDVEPDEEDWDDDWDEDDEDDEEDWDDDDEE